MSQGGAEGIFLQCPEFIHSVFLTRFVWRFAFCQSPAERQFQRYREDFGLAKEGWFKTFLSLRHGIPPHDTFNRVLAALDSKGFRDCFLRWTQSLRQAVPREIVALDGKALRRALNKDQSVQYVVSAWAESNGLVLGQWKVSESAGVPFRSDAINLDRFIAATEKLIELRQNNLSAWRLERAS